MKSALKRQKNVYLQSVPRENAECHKKWVEEEYEN